MVEPWKSSASWDHHNRSTSQPSLFTISLALKLTIRKYQEYLPGFFLMKWNEMDTRTSCLIT